MARFLTSKWLAVCALVWWGDCACGQQIDFARQIRPLLSENCFFCHGPDAQHREADLRLDTQSGASTVIVPGNRADSQLWQRLISHEADAVMPPPSSKRQLTAAQIELIGQWIEQGAAWETHWAFQPLKSPSVPTATATSWAAPVRNPIDAFVQQQLVGTGLQPSVEASPSELIRRVALDLTGLPPELEEVRAFVDNPDADAYQRLVEHYLDSPRFGERMAWDWLDAARYADTNGYQGDNERTMWPWRDWVVKAFNTNLPFDQFTIWQLAGDLLPNATQEQILATGFLRNHMINGEGGRIAEENRIEYVFDMTETTGTVWLGLTLNCCRCHDHKYDPLTNRDYYNLFAFFNQTPVTGRGGDPQTAPNLAVASDKQQSELAALDQQLARGRRRLKRVEATISSRPPRPRTPLTEKSPSSAVTQHPDYQAVQTQLANTQLQRERLEKQIPKVMVMGTIEQPRQTFMLERGLYNRPTTEAFPATPAFLTNNQPGEPNRLLLARWLVSNDNPLLPRVTVNRFWQQLFGVGLVKTSEDFGVQGQAPVQLELLNWLAAEFRDSGWNVKQLLRTIVTSHTYRQSSRQTSAHRELDPENSLLARGARYRLPAWMLRDQALAVSGLLSPVVSGPAVSTYQPAGVWEEATFGRKSYARGNGEELYRRSLFIFWRRIIAPTVFFDNASRQTCTVKSVRTNTPLHALLTLNETTYVEAARKLSERVLLARVDDERRLDEALLRVLARPATAQEREILLQGLKRNRQHFAAAPEQAQQLLLVGDSPRSADLAPVEHASWTALCLSILNLDEALNRQ